MSGSADEPQYLIVRSIGAGLVVARPRGLGNFVGFSAEYSSQIFCCCCCCCCCGRRTWDTTSEQCRQWLETSERFWMAWWTNLDCLIANRNAYRVKSYAVKWRNTWSNSQANSFRFPNERWHMRVLALCNASKDPDFQREKHCKKRTIPISFIKSALKWRCVDLFALDMLTHSQTVCRAELAIKSN